MHHDGVSWVGAYDMSGNVWERVSSLYLPYPYSVETHEGKGAEGVWRVIKGGAFDLIFNIANRDRAFTYLPIGFRCVRDAE